MKCFYSACILLIATITVGCASGGGRRSACALTREDSALIRGVPLYRACMVDDTARVLNLASVNVDFTPTGGTGTQCFSADIEFVVSGRGIPEEGTAREIRATTSTFASAVIASVPQMRYQAARKDGVAVRQIVRLKRTLAAMNRVVVVSSSGGAPPTPTRSPSTAPRC
jgi:hypothetical protein